MTLTEKWKKGELERGRYYIKYRGNYMQDNWHGDCWEDSWSEYVEEVLAPVPSYEEWQKVLNIDFINEVLRLENAKLKELLNKCREKLDRLDYGCEVWQGELTGFIEEIDNAIGEKNNGN